MPNPHGRSQLIEAAERVLSRDGVQGVTGRAVTREAGCATGLLYKYFDDLDDLLVALVTARFQTQAEEWAALPTLAGTRTVSENLTDAGLALLDSRALALAGLVSARPKLATAMARSLSGGAAGFPDLTASVGAYLKAEQSLGRVDAATDCEAVSFLLVAAAHHLLFGHGAPAPVALRPLIERVIAALRLH